MAEDATWLSEAVVEFLKGPMYINPLMSFIDERCLIFTPDEENKLEYTTCHNDFKDLVDKLLTDFLAQLGVGPDEFFKVISAAHETDRLTNFVVQTILTVDDFLMFKAMMVRRNIDLTSQVLSAVFANSEGAESSGPSLTSQAVSTSEEEQALREAMDLSSRLHLEWSEAEQLQKAMRSLQLEDEDVALPLAIALSLRDLTKFDSELADIELAIALSMALDEERRRLAAEGGAAAASPGGAKAGAAAAASPGGAKAGAAAKGAAAGKAAAGESHPVIAKAAPAAAAAAASLPPVKDKPAGAAPAAPAAAAQPPAAAAADAASPRPGKFVPAPIDAPTGASVARSRNRPAGFKGEVNPVDMEAIRKAAQQAAESQKKLIGKGDGNDEASKWLQEAKKKLVAARAADREQEMEAYKASAGKPAKPAGGAAAASPDDAKRAALREALAQKMRQSILQQQ